MKRLVLDPNTLVSGVAGIKSGSPPALLIRAMQAMRFEIAICPEILREVGKALRKPVLSRPSASLPRRVWPLRESAMSRSPWRNPMMLNQYCEILGTIT